MANRAVGLSAGRPLLRVPRLHTYIHIYRYMLALLHAAVDRRYVPQPIVPHDLARLLSLSSHRAELRRQRPMPFAFCHVLQSRHHRRETSKQARKQSGSLQFVVVVREAETNTVSRTLIYPTLVLVHTMRFAHDTTRHERCTRDRQRHCTGLALPTPATFFSSLLRASLSRIPT